MMYVNHKIFVAALLTLYTYLDICDAQKTVRDSKKVLTRNSLAKLIESVCIKTVWNLVWALNEVPIGLNTCQVIRSHCLMRPSDHLITSWKYVMCLISQPSEKLETPFEWLTKVRHFSKNWNHSFNNSRPQLGRNFLPSLKYRKY